MRKTRNEISNEFSRLWSEKRFLPARPSNRQKLLSPSQTPSDHRSTSSVNRKEKYMLTVPLQTEEVQDNYERSKVALIT